MGAGVIVLQRHYRLPEQFETVFLQCIVDARRPLHFLAPTHQVDVVFLVAVDSVAPRILGGRAGTVRRTE